jgi:hypothetical protein
MTQDAPIHAVERALNGHPSIPGFQGDNIAYLECGRPDSDRHSRIMAVPKMAYHDFPLVSCNAI